jgi:hypothetical protein
MGFTRDWKAISGLAKLDMARLVWHNITSRNDGVYRLYGYSTRSIVPFWVERSGGHWKILEDYIASGDLYSIAEVCSTDTSTGFGDSISLQQTLLHPKDFDTHRDSGRKLNIGRPKGEKRRPA